MLRLLSVLPVHAGRPAPSVFGQISLTVKPVYEESLESQLLDCDNMSEIQGLGFIDLDIHIQKCEGLPQQYASRIRVQFGFPDHIINSMRVLNSNDQWVDKIDSDGNGEIDEDDEDGTQRGGSYITPAPPASDKVQVTINPKIDFQCRIRIHGNDKKAKLSRKTLNWFKEGDLILTVLGENTSLGKYKEKGGVNQAASAEMQKSTQKIKAENKAIQAQIKAKKSKDGLYGIEGIIASVEALDEAARDELIAKINEQGIFS